MTCYVVLCFATTPQASLVRLYVYRMVKKVRRLTGGAGELQRICSSEHSAAMTARFWDEWRSSRRLGASFRAHAAQLDMDVERATADICRVKRLPPTGDAARNVGRCLQDIKGVNALADALRKLAAIPFTSGDPIHEEELAALWDALLPGVKRPGRITKDWGRIGFQQADPATDFRGGGLLALRQLLHFARTRPHTARRMIAEPADEIKRYPWACVGINITNEALKLLNDRLLDRQLYGLPQARAVDTFHSIYADMFEVLHAMWLEADPDNILAFPPVMKSAMAKVRDEIIRTGTLVPPGATNSNVLD